MNKMVLIGAMFLSMVGCAMERSSPPYDAVYPRQECIINEEDMGYITVEQCEASYDALASMFPDYPSLRECLAGAELRIVYTLAELGEACQNPNPASIAGCYLWQPGWSTYTVVVWWDVWPGDYFNFVWEHELRHRAHDCVYNDGGDHEHDGEFFENF